MLRDFAQRKANPKSENDPVSPRQGSPVPRELLPPYIGRCQSSATSIFQPPLSRRTTTSSQHARPSGVLRRRSDGLECAAWRPPRPVECRQFPEEAKDASVAECTWTLIALEALRNALYEFKTYLLMHCRNKNEWRTHVSCKMCNTCHTMDSTHSSNTAVRWW